MRWFFKNPPSAGFSLVELMVVLLIISLMAAMVGPRLYASLEKLSAAAEERKLKGLLETVKNTSFSRQSPFVVQLNNHRLAILDASMAPVVSMDFKHLHFKTAVVRYNANGFADAKTLDYTRGQGGKQLALKP